MSFSVPVGHAVVYDDHHHSTSPYLSAKLRPCRFYSGDEMLNVFKLLSGEECGNELETPPLPPPLFADQKKTPTENSARAIKRSA